jgi:hypothetical protein
MCFKGNLLRKSKKELIEFCKEKKIKNYSRKSKEDLIAYILENLKLEEETENRALPVKFVYSEQELVDRKMDELRELCVKHHIAIFNKRKKELLIRALLGVKTIQRFSEISYKLPNGTLIELETYHNYLNLTQLTALLGKDLKQWLRNNESKIEALQSLTSLPLIKKDIFVKDKPDQIFVHVIAIISFSFWLGAPVCILTIDAFIKQKDVSIDDREARLIAVQDSLEMSQHQVTLLQKKRIYPQFPVGEGFYILMDDKTNRIIFGITNNLNVRLRFYRVVIPKVKVVSFFGTTREYSSSIELTFKRRWVNFRSSPHCSETLEFSEDGGTMTVVEGLSNIDQVFKSDLEFIVTWLRAQGQFESPELYNTSVG